MTTLRGKLRMFLVAVRMMVLCTIALGIIYPLAMTGLGQLAFSHKANGSLVRDGQGNVVGSELLGQNFTDATGQPLPEYFQPRPSAAGDEGYDAASSGGSNQGPENPELIDSIEQRRADIAEMNGVSPEQVPADAVTASGSGLDPHISVAYAELQVNRVAKARKLDTAEVRELMHQNTTGRELGYMGEPRVNVVRLNLALDERG